MSGCSRRENGGGGKSGLPRAAHLENIRASLKRDRIRATETSNRKGAK